MKKLKSLLLLMLVSVAVFAQPELLTKDLPNTTGGTLGTIAYIVAGFIFYFFMQWRKKKIQNPSLTFNLPTWLNHNWYNAVFYLIAIFLIYWNAGAMNPVAAFSLGVAPNVILDFTGVVINKK